MRREMISKDHLIKQLYAEIEVCSFFLMSYLEQKLSFSIKKDSDCVIENLKEKYSNIEKNLAR